MCDLHNIEDMVARVQDNHLQIFLFKQAHFVLHQRRCIGGGIYNRAFRARFAETQAQSQGCLELYSGTFTQAVNGGDLLGWGMIDAL